jgi:hypothetical protein
LLVACRISIYIEFIVAYSAVSQFIIIVIYRYYWPTSFESILVALSISFIIVCTNYCAIERHDGQVVIVNAKSKIAFRIASLPPAFFVDKVMNDHNRRTIDGRPQNVFPPVQVQ